MAGYRMKFTFYFYAPWLERNINLVIIWFGFVKSIQVLKLIYISSIFTHFYLQTVKLVLVYYSSPSIDFHMQKKNVYWHIYGLCPQIFICRLRYSLFYKWSLSTDFYLQQTKEHVLVYSWSLFKMIICTRPRDMCWSTAGLPLRCLFAADKGAHTDLQVVSICRFLFAGKGTHTGVQQVSIHRFLS